MQNLSKSTKTKKTIIIAVLVALVFSCMLIIALTNVTFSKYVLEILGISSEIQSDEFYFTSNNLSVENPTYERESFFATNDGTSTAKIYLGDEEIDSTYSYFEFEVRNYENIWNINSSEITYEIKVVNNYNEDEFSQIADSFEETAILGGTQSNSYKVTIPSSWFESGSADITISVTSTYPYEKILSATYQIGAVFGNESTVTISDAIGENVAVLTISAFSGAGYCNLILPSGVYIDTSSISEDDYEWSDDEKYVIISMQRLETKEVRLFKSSSDVVYTISSGSVEIDGEDTTFYYFTCTDSNGGILLSGGTSLSDITS